MSDNIAGPAPGEHATPDRTQGTAEMAAIEADIARTRQELAGTVDQLTARLDVRTRIRNRAARAKDTATVRVHWARQQLVGIDGRPRPVAVGLGGGVLAAVAALTLVTLRRRPSSRHRRRRR